MPRSGVIGTYSLPPNTNNQAPNTPISSSMFNSFASDVQQTFNDPTPIAYGGTGAATASGAATALEVVSYAAQTLSGPQKAQALTNIGAVSSGSAILNDADQNAQSFSDAKKVNILKNTLQAWEIVPNGVVTLASNAADVTWTDLGSYVALRLAAVVPVTTADALVNFRAGFGGVDASSNYQYEALTAIDSSSSNPVGATAQNACLLIGAAGSASSTSFGTTNALFFNFNKARSMRYHGVSGSITAANSQRQTTIAGAHASATARDTLRILASTGQLAAGAFFVLEGIRG